MGSRVMGIHVLRIAVMAIVFLSPASWTPTADAARPQTGDYLTFADDGAWCWFQDPRAVYVEGAHKRTYTQWMTHDGRLQVGSYDHDTGERAVFTLKEKWGVDDHNVGSFLVLTDKRLIVFYATHGSTGLFCRTTRIPEDITQWEEEITVSGGSGVTYNHPVYLSAEKLFYVFWRGPSRKPTFSTSRDSKTWSEPRVLIREEGRDERVRPYLKVVSDGISTIHFAFTDGHPQTEPTNSLYYLRYHKGSFYKANGARVGDMDSLPIRHSQSDRIYDAAATNARAWVWDIALDAARRPVIVYTRMPSQTDHRYHYARWTGTEWLDTELCAAGRWFPQTQDGKTEKEPYYSGGMCLYHANPSILYMARQVKGVFEIEKWITPDRGKIWTSIPITRDSTDLNVRPVTPRGYAGKHNHVLWMHGTYVHFTNYRTGIRMLPVPGSTNQAD